jgi:hypothetical protein
VISVDRVKLIWISTKESVFAGCKLRFLVVFCFADFVLRSQVSSSRRGAVCSFVAARDPS